MADTDDTQPTASDITERGFYFCPSVKHAIVPPALVSAAVEEAGVQQEADGFWYFECKPVCGGFALRMRPMPKRYFAFEKNTEHSDLKIVSRDLSNVGIISARWGQIHVYFNAGPKTLYAWRVGRSIYLRKRFTEEEWALLTPSLQQEINGYEALTHKLG